MPGSTSIYHLWKAFDINSNVGGACGEIVALKGRYGLNLLNPLGKVSVGQACSLVIDTPMQLQPRISSIRCQTFWISRCMCLAWAQILFPDLSSESVFGYISVLPGAFSAYRYIALQNDKNGEGPLHKYFLGEKMVRFANK